MKAPELIAKTWLNSEPLSLKKLKGKVVAIHAFQMLCPGCVLHGVPQAQKAFDLFSEEHVAVIGLHTVFEHHEAMQEESLKTFLHEFRVTFPVAIDDPTPNASIPQTMALYGLGGTPTWILIDRQGDIHMQALGQMSDLILGAELAKLATHGEFQKADIYKREKKGF